MVVGTSLQHVDRIRKYTFRILPSGVDRCDPNRRWMKHSYESGRIACTDHDN
jgi:hypothetical protein